MKNLEKYRLDTLIRLRESQIENFENFPKEYKFTWKLFWKFILVITTINFTIQMTLLTFYHYNNLTFYLINGSLTVISSIILNFYEFKDKWKIKL